MATIIPFPAPLPPLSPEAGLPRLAAAVEAQRRAFSAWRAATADLALGLDCLRDALLAFENVIADAEAGVDAKAGPVRAGSPNPL